MSGDVDQDKTRISPLSHCESRMKRQHHPAGQSDEKTSPFIACYRSLLATAERLTPKGLFHVPGVREKQIALTIDDGPSSRTGEILDILRHFGSRATFFLHTDRFDCTPGARGVVERMVEEGHEISNHMPDVRRSFSLSAREFDAEFERAHRRLEAAGQVPRFFRAAGGFFHVNRMLPSLQRFEYYQRFVMASYLPWDTHFPFPHRYANHLAAGVFPGAIYVLHDGDQVRGRRLERTLEALHTLLERLRQRGYKATTLGELVDRAQQDVPAR
jgi:peptidoglycan/xylan/chitin deacetylase (PgdA/CDA1 family)